MSSKIEITRKAESRTGMTLGEVNQFIQECDAAGIDPRAGIKVTTGWKQQIMVLAASSAEQASLDANAEGNR